MKKWQIYQKGRYYRVGKQVSSFIKFPTQMAVNLVWYEQSPYGIFETAFLDWAKERCDYLNDPSPWKVLKEEENK